MKQIRNICLVLVILAGLVSGCALNPSSSGVDYNAAASVQAGLADVRVVLGSDALASLRAVTTIYTVKVVLLVANPGDATNPWFKLVKEVDISGSSAAASFSAVPARPVVVQVLLNNAAISGTRAFHGAKDLQSGVENVISPVAAGTGSTGDLIARVALEFFNNSSLMAAAGSNLVATVETAAATAGSFDELFSSVVSSINPGGLVVLAADSVPTTLKIGAISKTAAEIWAGSELWTTTPANMTVRNILRQGLNNYGLVHWAHARENDHAIARIATADGSKAAYCRNFGELKHFISLKDGSIIAAGYNNAKNAPVVFRWDTSTNASAFSASGISDSGLKWVNYLPEIAADMSGYSINSMVSDYDSIVYLILAAPDSSKVEYRLDLGTGQRVFVPGTALDGKQKVLAAHTELQSILENNSLSEESRTAKFISYVADDFKDIAGNPNKRGEVESTTLSRLQRYIINSYTFGPSAIEIVDGSTIKVTTTMQINVTRKPGTTGAVTAADIRVIPEPEIIWKRYGTVWKIHQGLPYKSSEIGI
jgi:hypothetical protein